MARITVEDCLKKIPNRFQLTLAATYDQLLRALATRSLHHGLVVFTGDDRELDDELRALCVRIRPTTTHSPAPCWIGARAPSGTPPVGS